MPRFRDDASFWKGLALGVGGAAVAAIGLWAFDRTPPMIPAASAQFPAIAGGGGVYLMPGQLATNIWGVYLLDTDQGTLMVYRYDLPSTELQLLAARDVGGDRGLAAFNTAPPPDEIRRLVEVERQSREAGN